MENYKFNQYVYLINQDLRSDAIQYLFKFNNGYKVSVVKGLYRQGYEEGLWELAVFIDDEIDYEHPVMNGDVRGYLTELQVANMLEEVKNTIVN